VNLISASISLLQNIYTFFEIVSNLGFGPGSTAETFATGIASISYQLTKQFSGVSGVSNAGDAFALSMNRFG